MVVVPTQPDVRLVYRDTLFETAGAAMAWMAVIVLVGAAGVDLYRRLRPPSR
jgi:hypothetical protein